MLTTKSGIKKIHIRKRNTNPEFSKFPLTSVNYKYTNINPVNSVKLIKSKSQSYQRDKSIAVKSFDININPSKIMTPQNKNYKILKDIISSPKSTTIKLFDNNSVYISITSKIEGIIVKYKKNVLKLNYILNKIENSINNIIKDEEEKNNKTNSESDKNKSILLKNHLIKFNENNKSKPKSGFNSSNEIQNEETIWEKKLLKKKINKLYQKINEMEIKFKIEELNYFFCIGEHQKKINELEKKLSMKDIDKMPKDELKQFLCYPHYVKFDVKEDINPKSIPMFNLRKNKCKTSKHPNKKSKANLTSSDNNLYENYFKNNIDNNLEIFDTIRKNNLENEEKVFSDKGFEINEIKNTIKLGKMEYDTQISIVDKFLGKKKSFFISHPKLNYIKVGKDGKQLTSWKIDNQLSNFPQQISKLKISKSQKNSMIIFPSSFNETMANLEKLRTNKNFKSIENKFEETMKLNKKK